MKLNGWQRLWAMIVLLWTIIIAVITYFASKEFDVGKELDLPAVFSIWLIPPISLYLLGLLIAWVIRGFKKEAE